MGSIDRSPWIACSANGVGIFCSLLIVAVSVEMARGQANPNLGRVRFPVMIRLSESLFVSPQPEVDHLASVDQCVLGIRNRGVAHVTGQVMPNFMSSPQDTLLQIVFRGHSVSRTTGRHGPATIHSTVDCQFDLRTLVRFDEVKGFAADPAAGPCDVVRTSQHVAAALPGLRGRIVRRVARKRLQEKRGRILMIAEKNTQTRLAHAMDRRVRERLGQWNEHWLKLRASLQQQAWYPEAPKLTFVSDERSLLVLVSGGAAKSAEHAMVNLKPAGLPEPRAGDLAEIILDNQWLASRADADKIVTYITASSQPLLVMLLSPGKLQVVTSQSSGWTIFHLEAIATE